MVRYWRVVVLMAPFCCGIRSFISHLLPPLSQSKVCRRCPLGLVARIWNPEVLSIDKKKQDAALQNHRQQPQQNMGAIGNCSAERRNSLHGETIFICRFTCTLSYADYHHWIFGYRLGVEQLECQGVGQLEPDKRFPLLWGAIIFRW